MDDNIEKYPLSLSELRDNFLRSLPKVTLSDLNTNNSVDRKPVLDQWCPICIVPFRDIFEEAKPGPSKGNVDQDLPVVTMLSCKHIFCWNDLTRWLASANRTCPMCRVVLFNDPWEEELKDMDADVDEESAYATSEDDDIASSSDFEIDDDYPQVPNSEMQDLAEDLREMIASANRAVDEAEEKIEAALIEIELLTLRRNALEDGPDTSDVEQQLRALQAGIVDSREIITRARQQMDYVVDIAENTGILGHIWTN